MLFLHKLLNILKINNLQNKTIFKSKIKKVHKNVILISTVIFFGDFVHHK